MIISLPDLSRQIRDLKSNAKTIVLATGVFDIIHQEHQNFLKAAKKRGDVLIVGLESDIRVKSLKGPGRPIHHQTVRLQNLDQLQLADFVFLLPQQFNAPQDHENLIAAIQPNILAVSSHTNHLDKKRRIIQKFGGKLEVVHQHNPAISTTLIINNQNQS